MNLRTVAAASLLLLGSACNSMGSHDAGQLVAHHVFFTLQTDSDEAREELVASCHESLSQIDGILEFSAGTRVEELTGAANDTEYHVSLHILFESREALDAYIEDANHLAFLGQNADDWTNVRVFDSHVSRR